MSGSERGLCFPVAVRAVRGNGGFSLIELMVAITLALFLVFVLVGVIVAVGSSARVQTGTTRLQENARYALRLIADDVRQAAVSHCLNFAAADGNIAPGASAHVDSVRPLMVAFDATGAPLRLGVPGVSGTYFVDPGEFLMGSECPVAGACAPDPDNFRALLSAALPAIGTAAGARARAADVLSMRYFRGTGLRLTAVDFTAADGVPATLTLADDLPMAFASAPMLAIDCSASIAARMAKTGARVLQLQGNYDNDTMPELNPASARLFNLQNDLVTVSYYLRLDTDDNNRLTSRLVRRVNGADEVVADGIERLDFLYHLEQADGTTLVLNAGQVDALGDAGCRGLAAPAGVDITPAACGWRSLKGIEVFLLANTAEDVIPSGGAVSPHAFRYAWRVDGTPNVNAAYESPEDIVALPSGLPPGRMLRREFRTFIAMRGMNP